MPQLDRRSLLAAIGAMTLPPALAKAAAIDADVRTGTIKDVEHVVILMQENRSFDHYFGTMAGVRGFGDRFTIPVKDAKESKEWSVFAQAYKDQRIAPFPLETTKTFAHMRVESTPHSWTNAQDAWDQGRMDRWPESKEPWSMGYFERADIPFQFALADAFTLCDAYHCSTQTGTNTNRLFLWTGTNDPAGDLGGPSISNSHDDFPDKGGAGLLSLDDLSRAAAEGRRLLADLPGHGRQLHRQPAGRLQGLPRGPQGVPGSDKRLKDLALTTQHLDKLREDVVTGRLPQVSWIIAPAADSEHPAPSSPAQGAAYTARVIEALTADPKVWARTVLIVNFDENDGFFDHMPPPSPPSKDAAGKLIGGSTVDLAGMHHTVRNPTEAKAERDELMNRPYGLGPRVPLYAISPWSRGGYVDSEVFDHTSVIRFLETRFGVMEPNIAPWRRAVCGDLTSCFDFKTPNHKPFAPLPSVAEAAARAAKLPEIKPPTPTTMVAPVQAKGTRPSRALPYALAVDGRVKDGAMTLSLANSGSAAAVIHVYDRLKLDTVPRRYTVGPKAWLEDAWPAGPHDLWVLGPNGFHRRFAGQDIGIEVTARARDGAVQLTLTNAAKEPRILIVEGGKAPWRVTLGKTEAKAFATDHGWYDLIVRDAADPTWLRRLAGRIETGRDSISDPLMGGVARLSA
jgi:phospholipase C